MSILIYASIFGAAIRVSINALMLLQAVDAMVETILSEMEKGEKISILGFGSFTVVEKSARKGVNPRTKEVIEIPARKVIKFKPGAELVSSVS